MLLLLLIIWFPNLKLLKMLFCMTARLCIPKIVQSTQFVLPHS